MKLFTIELFRLLTVLVLVNLVGVIGSLPFLASELISVQLFGSLLVLQLLGFIGVGSAYLWVIDEDKLDAIDIYKPTATELKLVVGTALLVVLTSAGISLTAIVLGVEPAENQIGQYLEQSDLFVLLFVFASIFIVGPAEEFFFRGVFQYRLAKYQSPALAIGVTSVVFALVHIPSMAYTGVSGALVYLLVLLAGSVVFGYAYEKTNNLLVPVLSHGVYNAIISLQLLFV